MHPVDWKLRYDTLAKFAADLAYKLHEATHVQQRIEYHIRESDRLSQRERGVQRYFRLIEDIELTPECSNPVYSKRSRLFKKGSLIDAVGYPPNYKSSVQICLDDDGDGFLYFPAEVLEEVELKDDEVSWDMVVSSR